MGLNEKIIGLQIKIILMSRPPDRAAFAKKLNLLIKFKKEHGHLNVPRDYPDRSLVNWLSVQKQAFTAGTLSQERATLLKEAGYVFEAIRTRPGQASCTASFANAFEQLSQWLDEKESTTGRRNLTYRETQTCDQAKSAYRFVEETALQAQRGLLSDTHRTRLMMLAFTVNGQAIDTFLPVGTGRPVQNVDDELQYFGEVESHTGHEQDYLTTKELAQRINYTPKTIREVLKDNVLLETRHYIRLAGRRKILWIWDAIRSDIANGIITLEIGRGSVGPGSARDDTGNRRAKS